jgi:uncharacterized protein YqgC (DUF456 family)
VELALVITVGVLFAIIGLACVASVVIGLPGTWILIGLALVIEMSDTLYLAPEREQTFQWWLLGVCVVLAAIGEGLEFIAGALGAKKAGSSRRGMVGALIGGVAGAFLGIGIPVPVVGSLIGAVIGTFAGAIAGEMTGHQTTTIGETIRPATGATVGRILGTLSKVPIAVIVWCALTVDAFWP